MRIGEHMTMDQDLKMVPDSGFQQFIQRLMTEDQRALWQAFYEPLREALAATPLEGAELVRWKYQRYMQDYLACVQSVDDNVGRMLDYLDKAGLADNTLVVYTSDNGFFLGDHGWYDKRFMYEESLRMPFLVRYPRVTPAGSACPEMVLNVDFAQTFLDLAGVPALPTMQGRSLVPLLRGQRAANWRDAIYYQYFEHGAHGVPRHYGVRTDRYKLIHYPTTGESELFDLRSDPDELRSIHDDPAQADRVQQLKTRLQQLREQYRVPPDGDFRQ
jgi:arylsulfatase A-like enzyme